tara:strand:- start:531 stop:1232 length:702 start_codon:yes stop_codon:yes gene_type:complete
MNYNYSEFIRDPNELGTITTLSGNEKSDNIKMKDYLSTLISGSSDAFSASPLGNAYFLDTESQCKDIDTGDLQSRFIFISNITHTNIPFPDSFMGFNFLQTKGLLPGIINNINNINNIDLQSSLIDGNLPQCQKIKMQTIDNKNNVNTESNYVALADIEDLDPCDFTNGTNPITNETCMEAFTSLEQLEESRKKGKMPADFYSQLYLGSLGILGAYIFYCLYQKHSKKVRFVK